MRKHLLCSVAAIAIIAVTQGSVLAADPYQPALTAPTGDWSGFYVGGHLGLGTARFTTLPHADSTDNGIARNRPSGLVGGMHIGQNWQSNTFVYGWEADASAAGLSQLKRFPFESERAIDTKVNVLASLRGRLGMTFDRTLLYATGGLAYMNAAYVGVSPGGTLHAGKYNKLGGVVGLGAEWMHRENFSLRAEGLYYIFNSKKEFGTDSHSPGWRSTFKDALVFRIGATHHFN